MEKKKKSEEEEDDENLKEEEKDIKGKGKGKGKVAGGLCQIFVLTSTGSGRYCISESGPILILLGGNGATIFVIRIMIRRHC